jgi:cation transport regulator ChaC
MTLYFAYGSNMDRAAMAQRCPEARALGVAMLADHRFLVARAGFASVERRPGSTVHGVLWRVSQRDLVALDAYESVATGLFRRAWLPVRRGNATLRALVYVACDNRRGRPRPGYQEAAVLRPAGDWGFPSAYLEELAGWAVAHGSVRCGRSAQ